MGRGKKGNRTGKGTERKGKEKEEEKEKGQGQEREVAFRPFAEALKGIVAKPGPAAAPKALVVKPSPPAKPKAPERDDRELFLEAVGDVKKLADRERVAPAKAPPPSVPLYDEDAEALAKLAAMMDGAEPLGHEFSDEHDEWIAEDADAAILKRLVAGEYAWQDHVDLHGMTRDQAKQAIFRFLAQARVKRHRCVLIVTGRGKHSEEGTPVLKPLVHRWLRRGAIKQWVFAYATARPVDGGAGAMYVLLRK